MSSKEFSLSDMVANPSSLYSQVSDLSSQISESGLEDGHVVAEENPSNPYLDEYNEQTAVKVPVQDEFIPRERNLQSKDLTSIQQMVSELQRQVQSIREADRKKAIEIQQLKTDMAEVKNYNYKLLMNNVELKDQNAAQAERLSALQRKSEHLPEEIENLKAILQCKESDSCSLQTEVTDLKQRVVKMETMREIKEKSVCYVRLTRSSYLKPGRNKMNMISRYFVKSDYFDTTACTYNVPVTGDYWLGGYVSQMNDGALEMFAAFTGDWTKIVRTDKAGGWLRGSSIRHLK